VSGRALRHTGVAVALATALCAGALTVPSVAPAAVTVPAAVTLPAGVTGSSADLARVTGARGFGGFGRSYRSYRSPGYGYRYRTRRGHGFLHGLFWGWMLSHFFGGGFPLGWLLLVGLAVLLLRRRRRRRTFGY
jgi:hypothetical protein